MNCLLENYVTFLGMDIAWIDIVVLGILVILLIVGLCLGLLRQLANLFSPLLAAVISYFTCKPFANYLTTLEKVNTTVSGWFEGVIDSSFNASTIDEAVAAVKNSKIPSFLQSVLINLVEEQGTEILTNFRNTILDALTKYTIIAIAFVLLFVALLIIFVVLKKIFKAISKAKNAVSFVDKVLGAVFILIKGFVFIYIICFLASFVPEFNDLLTATANGSVTNKVMSWITEILAKYFAL